MAAKDNEASPPLSDVQAWFQSVMVHPDGVEAGVESDAAQAIAPLHRDQLEHMITRSEKVSARDRIAIYANAYYARLIECLGDSYPMLKRTLGEDVFNGFAFGYLQDYPSRSYTLTRLGDYFPQYLDATRPDRNTGGNDERSTDWPDFLIDLATLEHCIEEVFDGPGNEQKPTLKSGDLADVPPEQWPDLCLRTVPSLRLLRFRFPVNDYYSAMRECDEGETVDPPGPRDCYLAVSRRDYIVRRYELSRMQYDTLSALQEGATVADALERATSHTELDDMALAAELQQWFQAWTLREFFEGAAV
jgi:hypothetical protein